jgi:nitroreductase
MTHPKHADADHDVLDLIRERWSPRAFDASRPVPSGELRRLFEAARWAPSSRNEQPWRFVVAARDQSPEAHAALFEALQSFNQTWASAAPVLILVAVQLTGEQSGDVKRLAGYDAGQAVAFLTLQAQSQGLGIRQMEGFDHGKARRACRIPEAFEPVVVMAVGYPGSPETLALEKHRASERAPRKRHPIARFVFDGTWGTQMSS